MNTQATQQAFRNIEALITQALELHASDIHITPTRDFFSIRFRIHGVLGSATEVSNETGRALVQAFKAEGKMNIAETRRPQDARLNRNGTDFRLATHPSLHGENLVIRLLATQSRRTLSELGLNNAVAEQLEALIAFEHGLTLVAGATGSGKTTTLHALLNSLGEQAGRIATLEDPVEIINPQALQTDLSRLPHLSFADGLRSLMRQDPDTILVGEIRDEETAELTLNAALTGHRVFASIHAPDCLGVISRLCELNVRLGSLLNCLNGVLTQRLRTVPNEPRRQLQAEFINFRQMPRNAVLACDSLWSIQQLCNAGNYWPFSVNPEPKDKP